MEVLEVDLPSRWPERIRRAVESVATEYPEYLTLDPFENNQIPEAIRWEVLDAVGDTPLVIYHATKLLLHEMEAVKSSGLQAVSRAMLTHRIEQALVHKCISVEFAEYLMERGLSSASDRNRQGMTSVFTSRLALRRKFGLQRQFNLWGGEALWNDFEEGNPAFDTLRKIGEPTVIRGFADSNMQDDLRLSFFDLTFNLLKMWGGGREQDQRGGQFSVPGLPSDRILQIITERFDPSEWADIAPMSEWPTD